MKVRVARRTVLRGIAYGGAVGVGLPVLECMLDTIYVVSVTDSQDIPTVSQKSRRDVFGEGDARVSLDRNVIVVVDPAEII